MDAARFRAEFPVLRRITYLNAGTCGPMPGRAVAAARAEIERQAQEGRLRPAWKRRNELVTAARERYAALLGCAPADVALTTSTTDGVDVAIGGLQLGPRDEIVTSDSEHPGLLGPLQAVRDLRGVTVREVPLADVADAVGSRTRLVACSHISWATGEQAPAALAQVDVPVLLDGAQGLGAVPVDLDALGCEIYAGSGQKWLCGPIGAGMLYVAPSMRERLAAPRRGYQTYVDSSRGLEAELHPDARRFDSPSIPAETFAFALAAYDVFAAAGWNAVHARAAGLAAQLAGTLAERGRQVAPRGQTTLVSWNDPDAQATRDRLAQVGIAVRDLPGRPLVRASVGAWNDESDLERLVAAL